MYGNADISPAPKLNTLETLPGFCLSLEDSQQARAAWLLQTGGIHANKSAAAVHAVLLANCLMHILDRRFCHVVKFGDAACTRGATNSSWMLWRGSWRKEPETGTGAQLSWLSLTMISPEQVTTDIPIQTRIQRSGTSPEFRSRPLRSIPSARRPYRANKSIQTLRIKCAIQTLRVRQHGDVYARRVLLISSQLLWHLFCFTRKGPSRTSRIFFGLLRRWLSSCWAAGCGKAGSGCRDPQGLDRVRFGPWLMTRCSPFRQAVNSK